MAYLFTSESVSEGHPDKVADQISDALVDHFLAFDPQSKVACETMRYPIKIASAAPEINPMYEKVPVIEKLEIRKIAVSNPSRKIAKNTTKKMPHEESSMAFRACPSKTFLSLTFFDSQKITYQIKKAVKYKKTASNKA